MLPKMKDVRENEADRVIKLLAAEVLARQKIKYLIFRQFFVGVAYGLGASLGAAIIGGALIYLYRNILGGFVN